MRSLLIVVSLFFAFTSQAADDFRKWLEKQKTVSIEKMMANVSAKGTSLGSIIASPQKEAPNYYYHWTRDSGITADLMVSLYLESTGLVKQNFRTQLNEFARFSRTLQQAKAQGGIGEPFFKVDGQPFSNPWCRPQNDGPALRVIAMARFADVLLDEGDQDYVKWFFYDGKLPTDSLVKTDLEYISHHWREQNCDLWEESWGDHFYTRMVQRRALLDGARLADRLGDPMAASWYRAQAAQLEIEISKHWDGKKGILVPTLNGNGGVDYKASGLDSSIILAVLHGGTGDGFFDVTDSRLLATFEALVAAFKEIYPINQKGVGVAIGRYPEDQYAGADMSGGNPWVLLTAASARYAERVGKELRAQGRVDLAKTYFKKSEDFLRRIREYVGPDGAMAEQIQRSTGAMTSARDLTWSYVEFIQAVRDLPKGKVRPFSAPDPNDILRRHL